MTPAANANLDVLNAYRDEIEGAFPQYAAFQPNGALSTVKGIGEFLEANPGWKLATGSTENKAFIPDDVTDAITDAAIPLLGPRAPSPQVAAAIDLVIAEAKRIGIHLQ